MPSIDQIIKGLDLKAFLKAEDLKKRILFTLGALIIFRIGTYIPIPGINPNIIYEFTQKNINGIFGILDMFSGGAMGRMTIFSLNIMPYITSSIILQLMSSIIPSLENLKKDGETGRNKINQYTRYLTVLLAIIQSLGISLGLEHIVGTSGKAVVDSGLLFKFTTVLTLTGGTLFVVWLGEQITSRGIGNGASIIIYSGIVANLPQALISMLELGRTGMISVITLIFILIMIALVIAYIVFIERAQRKLIIQYPKRQILINKPAVSQTSYLPLKLNSSGVIPPIFSSSLLLLPMTFVGFSGSSSDSFLGNVARAFSHGKPIYILCYIGLIIFFSFFYIAIVFNPSETAENLRKSGAYLPGIRPGNPTAQFIDYVLTRLTLIGSIYLSSICIIPEIILSQTSLPFYFGGTSLLIVVSVTTDTISQIQSYMIAHQYEGLIKKAKSKGKNF